MIDWQMILGNLREMEDYFVGCWNNAAPGSEARKRFDGWLKTLENVVIEIEEAIMGEDDGK